MERGECGRPVESNEIPSWTGYVIFIKYLFCLGVCIYIVMTAPVNHPLVKANNSFFLIVGITIVYIVQTLIRMKDNINGRFVSLDDRDEL